MRLVIPLEDLRFVSLDYPWTSQCFAISSPSSLERLLWLAPPWLALPPCWQCYEFASIIGFFLPNPTTCGRANLPLTSLLSNHLLSVGVRHTSLVVKPTSQSCFDTTYHELGSFLSFHVALRQLKPLDVAKSNLPTYLAC